MAELDDLRGIVERCCEAVSKGDNPESIAAYLAIELHLMKEDRDRCESRCKRLEEAARRVLSQRVALAMGSSCLPDNPVVRVELNALANALKREGADG